MKFLAKTPFVLMSLMLISCQGTQDRRNQSKLAQVEIKDLPTSIEYERMDLRIQSGSAAPVRLSVPRGQRALPQTFNPGSYRIEIDLIGSGPQPRYSSTYCQAPYDNSQNVALASGPNKISVYLCDQSSGTVLNAADVEVAAVLITEISTDGRLYTTELTAEQPERYFSFQGVAGTRYAISAVGQNPSVLIDSLKTLYMVEDNRLRQVAEDDDSGGNLNPLINYTPAVNGIYVVRVRPFSGATGLVNVSVTQLP